ncbi:MAG TPA: molecular chaperone HtpG [Pirellulaceae bacterium]|jgi:molecular chaperone HtpG|nr:molecular chaperone HtpG [Pirellulaceae bacterium]
MNATTHDGAQTIEFRAEIKQLLQILVHSVYSSKEAFLRELLSNASDALEKVRFLKMQQQEIVEPDAELEIRIESAEPGRPRLLTIQDTGIGMTREEVETHLGTIANSGVATFLEQLKDRPEAASDVQLIGRFGIGFYAVFMVAEKVTILSRSARPGTKPIRWESDGSGSYRVEELDEDLPRGTRIEILMKESEQTYAEATTVRQTVRTYSNFLPYPIRLNGERINQTSALWREPPTQAKPEDYQAFYKLLSHDDAEPVATVHLSADAPVQFSALLFVPNENFETMGFGRAEQGLQLYVRRVLIDRENKDFLPEYLRFVQGVVESEDLPLNVSREVLQENALVRKIGQRLTGRVLDRLVDLSREEPEKYRAFWEKFGRILKEGYMDRAQTERLAELLRFKASFATEGESVSLSDYRAQMPERQKTIVFLSGPSRDALDRDPRLERFRQANIPVLYLLDLADEIVLSSIGKYKDLPLTSADRLTPEELRELWGEANEAASESDKPAASDALLEAVKQTLGDRVKQVRYSERLVDSPVCLASDAGQQSAQMERLMRMMGEQAPLPPRTLELNRRHPLIVRLDRLREKGDSPELTSDLMENLYEFAALLDGHLDSPHELARRSFRLLERTLPE